MSQTGSGYWTLYRTSAGAACLLAALLASACRSGSKDAPPSFKEGHVTNGTFSPTGEKHPGQIRFVDKIEKKVETKSASDVPQFIAWSRMKDKWVPVVQIVISGTHKNMEITSYGPGEQYLSTTIQAPR
jgi:hypothetical protein